MWESSRRNFAITGVICALVGCCKSYVGCRYALRFFLFLDSRKSAFIFSFAWRSGNTRFTDGLFIVRIRSPLGLTRRASTLPGAPSVLILMSGLETVPDDESSFLHHPGRITMTSPNNRVVSNVLFVFIVHKV